MAPISRRKFVQSSAVAVGAASLPLAAPLPGAASGRGFSPARRRTFVALVATVAEANGSRTLAPNLHAAGDAFGAWLAGAPAETRKLVVRTLDGVEAAARPGFSRLSPGRRLALLRGWRYSARADRRGLAYDAVVLASSPFGPPPSGDSAPEDI